MRTFNKNSVIIGKIMYEKNFGFESNGLKCTCGSHFGIGDQTPEQRAAIAGRMRDKLPAMMTENMKNFLADWERYHGPVHYRMDVIGTNTGEFVKFNKGQQLRGPVYVQQTRIGSGA